MLWQDKQGWRIRCALQTAKVVLREARQLMLTVAGLACMTEKANAKKRPHRAAEST